MSTLYDPLMMHELCDRSWYYYSKRDRVKNLKRCSSAINLSLKVVVLCTYLERGGTSELCCSEQSLSFVLFSDVVFYRSQGSASIKSQSTKSEQKPLLTVLEDTSSVIIPQVSSAASCLLVHNIPPMQFE